MLCCTNINLPLMKVSLAKIVAEMLWSWIYFFFYFSISRSKSLNDVSAEDQQSLRKIRYEELQKIKEQLQEQDLKWQEVNTSFHSSWCVLPKGWVLPMFSTPRKRVLAYVVIRVVVLWSDAFHATRSVSWGGKGNICLRQNWIYF